MRHLEINATVAGRAAGDVFPLLCDMEQYPKYSDTMLNLKVAGTENGTAVSTWTVRFGQGTATWTQEDSFDRGAATIRFKRLSGDIQDLTGAWVVQGSEEGCTLQFTADFDIGMPALAEIIEPMIETMLRDNISAILKGLLGPQILIQS
ncbi:MAG: SRPBCC family protein [Bryobacteraceae bacterium]|jgi:ribosome-associated toxin RatA of RatAB toxin-antitoxin module